MPDAKGRLYADDVAADLDIDPATWRAYVSRGQAPDPDDRVVDGPRVRPVWNPATVAEYKGTRGARRDVVEVVWERTVNADFEAGPTRGTPDDPNRYVRRRVTYGPWEPDPDGERYFREVGAQLAAQRAAADAEGNEPHVLQQYNPAGNVCHRPRCALTVEQHLPERNAT